MLRLHVRFPLRLHWFILCTRGPGVTAHEGGRCDQSIWSTVSDAFVNAGCGRLQLRVPHWATSVHYCKQSIIDPTFCGSRFSTERLLAIEDFTVTLHMFNQQLPTQPLRNHCVTEVYIKKLREAMHQQLLTSLNPFSVPDSRVAIKQQK